VPIVRIEPVGIEFEVPPGQTVAEAAWRQGYTWPTRCWGQAECMVCVTRILSGASQAEPANKEEMEQMADRLAPRLRHASARLACRLRVRGEGLVLEKRGVQPPSENGSVLGG
jgi:2Fe-2S ferredoxin